jgi:RNA polymerase sigma factor (TIGR02999 family)
VPDDVTANSSNMAEAYARLRRIAQRLMQHERAGHTLSATDVVHEAWARLLKTGTPPDGLPPVEFIRNVSRAMTEVLIDHARAKGAAKRGGGRARVSLDDLNDLSAAIDSSDLDWERLHAALDELAEADPRRHSVILLRFFGGLDSPAIAQQLGLDERTVRRDWSAAQLWLKKRLRDG